MNDLPAELRDLIFFEHLLPSTGVLPWLPSKDDKSINEGLKALASIELVCKSWRTLIMVIAFSFFYTLLKSSSLQDNDIWEKALISRFTDESLVKVEQECSTEVNSAPALNPKYGSLNHPSSDGIRLRNQCESN